MTEEEELELIAIEQERRRRGMASAPTAPAQDPAWLAKSKRGQEAARTSVEAEDLQRDPSTPEKAAAFGMGAAQSASMGAAPAARGAAAALAPLALGAAAPFVVDNPISGIPERYRAARDKQKEATEAFSSEKLGSSFGYGQGLMDLVNAALGVAAPAKSAVTALEDVASGAKVGDVLSTGAAPVMQKVKAALGSVLGKAGERADELRVLTTMGAHGGSIMPPAVLREVERVPGGMSEVADVLRKSKISHGITTTGGIAKRAAEAQASSGAKIGQMIDEAAQSGGFVDTKNLVTRMRAEAATADAGLEGVSEVNRQHAASLSRLADKIEKLSPGGVAPIDQVKSLSRALSEDAQQAYAAKAAGRPVQGKGQALMDTRRLTEGAIGETITDLGLDKGTYDAAKRLNQVSRIASETAEASLGRAGKNNLLGLTDIGMAQISAPIAIVNKVLKPFGSSIRATMAETARDLATTLQNPAAVAALGPNGPILKQAAEQGPEALKAALASMAVYGGELQAPPDQSLLGQAKSRLGQP